MQEDQKETEVEAQVDGSRRKLALALLGGFAGAGLLQACEEAEPGAPGLPKAREAQPDISELQQGLTLSMAAYDTAMELNSNPGPPGTSLIAIVAGRVARGDGGGGEFYWDPVSTRTKDDRIVFGTATQGRWICLHLHFENVAALKAFDPTGLATGTRATLGGYRTLNDGGQGELYFVEDPNEPSDVPVALIPGLAPPPGTVTTGSGNALIEGTNFRAIQSLSPLAFYPGKWHRVGVNAKVRRVRRPEEWGADNTGTTDSTYAIQAAMLWCEQRNAYLQGMGKYLISDTLYVTGMAWGFEFGPAGDEVNGTTGGLFWNGGDHVAGVNEDTYKPMIHIGKVRPLGPGHGTLTPVQAEPGVQGLQCGTICLNNRVNRSVGICGIKWTSYDAQCAGCDFKIIEICAMDGGLILGTRSFQQTDSLGRPRHDIAENAVFHVVRIMEVKHPIYINGGSNDMTTFENAFVGSYAEAGGGYWNGLSNYAIRVNSVMSGLVFKNLLVGHQDLVTDQALIDVVAGGIDIRQASIENGGRTCLAFRSSFTSGGRGPIILRNFFTSSFRDSTNTVARIDTSVGVILDGCTWRGNVHFTPSTGFVTGTCLFIGNYNFTGTVDQRVSVATFFDTDGNYVLENKRVGGPHNADTYNGAISVTTPLLLATGTIKNRTVTERIAEADVALFPGNGTTQPIFHVVFPNNTVDGNALVEVECMFYQGGSVAAVTVWKATLRYMIHRAPSLNAEPVVKATISVPSDADKLLLGGFTSATATAAYDTSANTATLRLGQSNNLQMGCRAVLKATMFSKTANVSLTPDASLVS